MAWLAPACAQIVQPPEQKASLDLQISALIAEARLAQPELAADILLKIARSKKLRDENWRLNLIEEALRAADDAQYGVRRQSIPVGGLPVDTQPGYLEYAFDLKLDRLSLKARAIEQLLEVRPGRAKQLLLELSNGLSLKPLPCEDTMAYEPSEIYRVAGAAAKRLFSAKESEDGARALFLLPWIENIESPTQISPALALVPDMQSLSEKRLLYAGVLKMFEKNLKDDRSLTYSLERGGIIRQLAALGRADEGFSPELQASFRAFLKKNWSVRCKDHEVGKEGTPPRYLAALNGFLVEKPFSLEELSESEFIGEPKVKSYWESADARRLQQEFREAQKKDSKANGPLTDEDWHRKLTTFLDNVDRWNPSNSESELEILNQKWVFYQVLIERVPEGKFRNEVILRYIRLLNSSSIQKNSFIEWFVLVKRLFASNPKLFEELSREVPNPTFQLIIDEAKLTL